MTVLLIQINLDSTDEHAFYILSFRLQDHFSH